MREVYRYSGSVLTIPFMVGDPAALVRQRGFNGRLVLGAVGRLVAHKRHAALVEAIAQLAGEGRDVGLLIAGDGPERENLQALARRLRVVDRVEFTGEFDDLSEVMARFDVFALVSSSESQCMPIVESAAYGRAAVVSRFGGMPDFVEDGETGIVVPLGDQEALVAAIRTLHADRETVERMGQAARRRYEREWTPDVVCARIEQAYDGLLSGSIA